jgi:hypothetical protein
MLGMNTSEVEILGISKHGFWILFDDEQEVFVSFAEFPWFRQATIEQILNVEQLQPQHLYWSELDIDLHVDLLGEPEIFAMVSNL